MKIKPISLLTMTTLCIALSSSSYAKESYNNRDSIRANHNPDEEKQAIMFQFIYEGLLTNMVQSLVEANNACDYCKLKKEFSSNKNCNLCKLLDQFPFKNLYKKLLAKLENFEKEELNSLKKLDSQLAEDLEQLLSAFSIQSKEELKQSSQLYETLFNLVQQKGYFPNILDHLTLWKNLAGDLVALFNLVEKSKITTLKLTLATKFSELLTDHKKFLDNNADTLSQIQQYLLSEYTMEDTNEVKSLRDILARITQTDNEEQPWEKDLL